MTFGGTQDPQNKEGASVSRVGYLESQTQEATSLLRPKLECKCKPDNYPIRHGPSNSAQTRKKVSLKKVARQKASDDAQAQDAEMLTNVAEVGSRRPSNFKTLEIEENRVQKRALHARSLPSPFFDDILGVAAM